MAIKLKFKGVVSKGKFTAEDPVAFAVRLQRLEGRKVEVTMNLWREFKLRSLSENSYFHGVVLPILSELTGYTDGEMKAVLKWMFKVKESSGLSTIEFEDFLSKVRAWASSELGC